MEFFFCTSSPLGASTWQASIMQGLLAIWCSGCRAGVQSDADAFAHIEPTPGWKGSRHDDKSILALCL